MQVEGEKKKYWVYERRGGKRKGIRQMEWEQKQENGVSQHRIRRKERRNGELQGNGEERGDGHVRERRTGEFKVKAA